MSSHAQSRQLRSLCALLVFVALSVQQAFAQRRPTITFDNKSGESAMVRLEGPTTGMVAVPDASARGVEVRGGEYRIFVRYGEPGNYRYTKGDPFTMTESSRGVSIVTITLHKVVNGNYGSQPSNEREFNNPK